MVVEQLSDQPEKLQPGSIGTQLEACDPDLVAAMIQSYWEVQKEKSDA